jgi:hypothetical protein
VVWFRGEGLSSDEGTDPVVPLWVNPARALIVIIMKCLDGKIPDVPGNIIVPALPQHHQYNEADRQNYQILVRC